MGKKEEYQALRDEILTSIQVVKNYRSFLYTIVIATLAFAFQKNDPILFLVPFCAILPLYLFTMQEIDSTLRMGAYIYVFIEPDTECQWETRLYRYDEKNKNQYSAKKTSINEYWAVSLCCIVLSFMKLDFCNRDFIFFLTVFIQVAIIVICIYVYVKKRPNYYEQKIKYINEWEKIKKGESNP